MSAQEELVAVEISMEEGDPLGATPDEQFVIIQIQKETLADGKLQIGDKILSVNDRQPKDLNNFYHLLNVAARESNKALIKVRRDRNKASELDVHNQVPAERGKYIKRREGYLYKLISIAYQKKQKLGLILKQNKNRVFVSRLEPNSLSARVLEVMDQIIDVESQPVTDADVARTAIINALKSKGYFTSVIARPTSAAMRAEVDECLRTRLNSVEHKPATQEEPSHKMALDVTEIAQREIDRLHTHQTGSSILAPPGTKHPKKAEINVKPNETQITSDTPSNTRLHHVGQVHSSSGK